MNDRLRPPGITIHTTTVCTLKCAHCGNSIPYFSKPHIADIDKTLSALDVVFQTYRYINEVRIGGAEAFLYPHVEKLINALSKYKSQFEYGILVTNGTYLPEMSIINTIREIKYPFLVRVDNYGELSKKYDELLLMLHDSGIRVDERIYTGEEQDFGGWIDYGGFSNRNYSEEKLNEVFLNCRIRDSGLQLFDDKLFFCCRTAYAAMSGNIPLGGDSDYITLSKDVRVDELKKIIQHSADSPFNGCQYCNGFDPIHSPRIPAAEQL